MNIREVVYRCALAGATSSERVARGFLYVGASVLKKRDLRELVECAWERYASDPAVLVSGLDDLEKRLYLPWVQPGDRLCVVGAGRGRDVLPFVDSGHDVVGVEPSPEPAEILRGVLRERGQPDNVVHGFIEDVELPGTFDVVLFSADCYGFIQGAQQRIAVLRKLGACLNSEGRILVTYQMRRSDWSGPAMALSALASKFARSDWQLEPHDTIRRARDYGRGIVCEHVFARDEIEREVAAAGLRVKLHERTPPFAVIVQ